MAVKMVAGPAVAAVRDRTYLMADMEAAMGAIASKVFKSGDGVAVQLPKEFGFAPGAPITIEQSGRNVTIRPVEDAEAALRNNQALVAEIRAIWDQAGGPPVPEKRDPDIFPDRPGLY